MSFFNDFLDTISIDDRINKVSCNVVFGLNVKIIADFKIVKMAEDEIILKCKKELFKVVGSGLSAVMIAKGEIEIEGNVTGVMKVWMGQFELKLKHWMLEQL